MPKQGVLLLQPASLPPAARFIHTSQLLFSDIVEVQGPAFAESISEGDIRWLKQKGDFVKEDELVAEIETDKTSVEVPAPFSGTIVELLVEDGQKVVAKQKLYKLQKGEAGAAASAPAPAAAPKKEEPKAAAAPPPPAPPKPSGEIPKEIPKASPPPAAPAKSTPVAQIRVTPGAPKGVPAEQAITGSRSETRVKTNRMRQRIAQRLKDAQNTYAMLTTFNEIDMRFES